MEKAKTRKLQIELSEQTFAYLEMLAFGLHIENSSESESVSNWKGFDKSRNDFAPAVRKLLESVAGSLADGVRRPGAWERQVVNQLTGWDGTYNPGMLADCIKDEVSKD